MNKYELEELIEEYSDFYPHRIFPSYEALETFYRAKVAAPISKEMYDNICENKWESVYGHGTINEGHWKSRDDYIK